MAIAGVRNAAFIDGQNLHLGIAASAGGLTGDASGFTSRNTIASIAPSTSSDPHYERALIVTSDGDFGCLVRYLYEQEKLERVLSPSRQRCSALLKRAARERIDFLENARGKIEYKAEGAPPQDVTRERTPSL